MEARYAIRKRQLLEECQVAPDIFEHVMPRLDNFMKPFVTIFHGQVADQHILCSWPPGIQTSIPISAIPEEPACVSSAEVQIAVILIGRR